jgi:DNA-binding NarL/FixJ family response regulator
VTTRKHRLVIVEDHALIRAGLRALLAQDPDIEIVGEADNGHSAVRTIGMLKPDLVLMDISMPGMNGMDAIREIKRHNPEIRVLVITIHRIAEYIHESLRAGADGYVLKDATQEELRNAVRTTLNGKTYLSPDIAGTVIDGYIGTMNASSRDRPWDTLTQREREVLKFIAEGRPNRHIAEHLCLSVKTVEKHRSNLMRKLDLHNASMLTAFAIENGLVAGTPA